MLTKLKFSWCQDYANTHQNCAVEFTYDGKLYECPCECHGKKEN